MQQDGDTASMTNVVFMGMGEPLHNLPAVLAATGIMCSPLVGGGWWVVQGLEAVPGRF
jgi:adenine C2-methylase RlmN of 23S rRNA A2503 and tRNA A37